MEQATCKKTFKLPQSSVLEKAKLFLPQIAEANSKLPEMSGQTDGEELNIENTSNCKGSVIEMNLGLFEYSTSSSEMDSSSSEDSGSEYCREVTERNFKIQKLLKRSKPHIEEITTPKTNPVNSKIPS